jgi:hypothetical protein
MKFPWHYLVTLALIALVGCAAGEPAPDASPLEPGEESPDVAPRSGVGISPISPQGASPLPSPSPSPPVLREEGDERPDGEGGDPLLLREEEEREVKSAVAAELDVEARELEVVEAEVVQWGNASLGCPEEGKVYAQMIVPGYRFVLEDEKGTVYRVHTSGDPRDFVLCDRPHEERPTLAPAPTGDADVSVPKAVLEAAKERVAEARAVPIEALKLESAEREEWRNSCLGCAPPDAICAMVITPGYRIILRAGDAVYEVHTDLQGASAVLCEGVGGAPPHRP